MTIDNQTKEVYEFRFTRHKVADLPQPLDGTTEGYARVLRPFFLGQENERFVVLYLDGDYRVMGSEVIAAGSADTVGFEPRDVFKGAVRVGALGIVVAHNHPSGALAPSIPDTRSTDMLLKAGAVLNIRVVDHLIFSDEGRYYSMRHGLNPLDAMAVFPVRRNTFTEIVTDALTPRDTDNARLLTNRLQDFAHRKMHPWHTDAELARAAERGRSEAPSSQELIGLLDEILRGRASD